MKTKTTANPIETKHCPKCKGETVMVEYSYDTPEHYDGVSEVMCLKTAENNETHWRIGRWCGQELASNELERRFCEGNKPHPTISK